MLQFEKFVLVCFVDLVVEISIYEFGENLGIPTNLGMVFVENHG